MPLFLKYLLALVYRIGYLLHHHFCLKSGKPLSHAQLIVVGSFLVGGAGKTPFCLWLVRRIPANYKVAVLCHFKAWDEVNLYKMKLYDCTNVRVFATKNRYKTAHEIDRLFDFIICDDGFEDSRLVGAKVIRLDWSQPPTSFKDLIPLGKHRSLVQDHEAPALVARCYGAERDVSFELETVEIADKRTRNAVVCGLGNPDRFVEDLKKAGVDVQTVIQRPDHDSKFTAAVISAMELADAVWMTEKDSCRLPAELQRNPKIRVVGQKVSVSPYFAQKVELLFRLNFI
ncbi:MAG: tetraacyldisaccharide 4'-kinase [Fibrobacter sp.]|nr:tetraacyldisaccharide 4'-kinase [Fibrobacter sp.]